MIHSHYLFNIIIINISFHRAMRVGETEELQLIAC